MAYRPTHQTECCAGAVHRIMPNYASRMWMRGRDGAVVAALYGPSEVTVKLPSGRPCLIKENTSYPFSESIDFSLTMEKKETFPLVLRVPSWCHGASIFVNGKPVRADLESGSFFTLEREFRNGDIVSLNLPMEIVREHVPMGGSTFSRGPLLYAYPVPENVEVDDKVYDNMAGKVPENPDFKCLSITPAGPWNYAVTGEDPVWSVTETDGYPFDRESIPGKITVSVKKIEWELWKGRFTPSVPKEPKAVSDQVETIDLIPYGATELRVSVFPELF